MENKNIACRIFKEQIDLIQQLPEKERAEVLYKAIISAFNQIENQIENQNEYAYVSVSDSVSELGKIVFSLLEKNIVCKEFSNNYGGRRTGAGRPVTTEEKQAKFQEVVKSIGIKGRNTITITPDFEIPHNEYFDAYRQQMPAETESVQTWIRQSNLVGKTINYTKIGEIIRKFREKRTGKIF